MPSAPGKKKALSGEKIDSSRFLREKPAKKGLQKEHR